MNTELTRLARRYIWWEPPEKALATPERVIAQVMTLGTLEDLDALTRTVARSSLVDTLQHARPGWFDAPAWAFWHHRLELISALERPPSLPMRQIEPLTLGCAHRCD
jgi:hypothetical protein